jgi:hypothetical protein
MLPRPMRLLGSLAIAAACAALSACGDDKETVERTTTVTSPPATTTTAPAPKPESAGYKSQVERAANRFKRQSESAAQKLRSASNASEFGAGADEFQHAVRTFNRKLASLTPPADAAKPQRRLIEVLTRFSDDVQAVRSALDRGDTQAVGGLASKVQGDVAAVQSAAQVLQDAAE